MKTLPSFTDLPLADITVPDDRLRPISEAKVAALMQVIGEGVFLGAITVRREGRVNTLIDGGHRLEAMRRLSRDTIRADVLTCSAAEARLLEVTGNLTAGMTPVQDAIFLGVYQAEYERQHPESRGGVAGALARHGLQRANLRVAQSDPSGPQAASVSFASVIAEQRQITPAQVRKVIAAGRALSRDERDQLQAVSSRIAISEVVKLGKIGDPGLRARAVEALTEGKSVGAALAAARAEDGPAPPVKDPVELAFKALSKAWSLAGAAARKRFLLEHAKEVWAAQNKGAALADWQKAVEK